MMTSFIYCQTAAGWLGFTAMVSSVVFAVFISRIVDRYKRKIKIFMKAMAVTGTLSIFIIACIQTHLFSVPSYMIKRKFENFENSM